MKKIVLLYILLLGVSSSFAQNLYDIQVPTEKYSKKCTKCVETLNTLPNEVQYYLSVKNNNIYLHFSHKEYFKKVFRNKHDGIAIDVVEKDTYNCNKSEVKFESFLRGYLLEPIYLKDMKKKMIPTKYGVLINLGQLPLKYKGKEIELNIIFLKKKYTCLYQISSNIESSRWDLVDMGFYLDEMTYVSDSVEKAEEKYIIKNKTLEFTIPFEKNKSTYSEEDIKPLYDSLKLTDYNITGISIRAYSSVEGPLENNLRLQDQRARSIANALVSIQGNSVPTNVTASENWVQFFNEIGYTKYSYFARLTKQEIKEKLKDPEINSVLEPYLAKHRKADITLELQKKDKYADLNKKELLDMLAVTVEELDYKKANEIQNSIFDKIGSGDFSPETVDQIVIPQTNSWSHFHNKNIMFKYALNQDYILEAYVELDSLRNRYPKDKKIQYNYMALKIQAWVLGAVEIEDPKLFAKEIQLLSRYRINSKLIKRMLVNYNIIMAQYYTLEGEFNLQDKCLKYINGSYKSLPLQDKDYLKLAQYMVSYSKYDWAKKMLIKKVKPIEADEDLVFYYIKLTMNDTKYTKTPEFRKIMLNAVNINSKRFCKIFSSNLDGGVSFQLLDNKYLRKIYCENCRE